MTKDLKKMRQAANAVWVTGCEVNNAKQDRRDEKDTLWDRLEAKLDKKRRKKIIMAQIIQFYMEENALIK